MKANPDMMVNRRSIVEHPFGNLKQWVMGNARFLLRQLKGTRTEMALAIQVYNLKRAINDGVDGLKSPFLLSETAKANAPTSRGICFLPAWAAFSHSLLLERFLCLQLLASR